MYTSFKCDSYYVLALATLGGVTNNQGDQIGRNFAIWVIFYGIGQIFF
jgi:hypothetical protein